MFIRLLVLIILLFTASCSRSDQKPSPPLTHTWSTQPLRVCIGTTYSLLPVIAGQMGFYSQEGLTVELIPFSIGRDAMDAMLAGTCDVTTSADTPVADYGLKRDDLRIIAGIATSDKLSTIVVRRSSGISSIEGLKGRRVGVTKGTAPHFFLDLVLNKHDMTEKSIDLAFMKGDPLLQNFRRGDLDAIATTDLNAYRLNDELGKDVLLLTDPGIALNHGYLSLLKPTIDGKHDQLIRLLTALRRAEKYVDIYPAEARRIFAGYLKVSPRVADMVFKGISSRLTLNGAMIMTLEDHARWLRDREGGAKMNRTFKGIVHAELLRHVAPESITLE